MKGKYTWSEHPTDEIWTYDRFDTIEECVKDAMANGKKPGSKIAIGICEDYVPHLDAGYLLDRVNEQAQEECGEVAEDWPEFVPGKGYRGENKLQEALDKVFAEWLKETHQIPGFYHVIPFADMEKIPGTESEVNEYE